MTRSRARPSAPPPRAPAPLPGHARAMLTAYRDAESIPPEIEARIWSVVGADDAPEPAFDPWDEPRPRGADRRWLTYGAATLAAAAILLLAWRMGGSLAERRQPERTPGAAAMQGDAAIPQGHAAPSTRQRTVAPPSPAPSTDPEPTTDPSTVAPSRPPSSTSPEASTPSPRSAPSSSDRPSTPTPIPGPRPTSPASDPEPSSSFAAERELVARAWRALALGEPARALEATAAHARRFPAGLLAPERDAIETIARCRQVPTHGPRRAAAFHRAHPRSPLAPRVDEACAPAPTAAPQTISPPE